MKYDLKNRFLSDSVLKTSFFYTYLWGFIAHMYAYFSDAFSHDSLVVYASIRERRWKIQLGRILVPVYRYLTRDGIEIPWLIGLLAAFLEKSIFSLQYPVSIEKIYNLFTTDCFPKVQSP